MADANQNAEGGLLKFNVDLLREVFQYLESGPKRHLLAVALTCKSFAEPAQDCLWKTMPSIIPFLRLLPSYEEVDGVSVRALPLILL